MVQSVHDLTLHDTIIRCPPREVPPTTDLFPSKLNQELLDHTPTFPSVIPSPIVHCIQILSLILLYETDVTQPFIPGILPKSLDPVSHVPPRTPHERTPSKGWSNPTDFRLRTERLTGSLPNKESHRCGRRRVRGSGLCLLNRTTKQWFLTSQQDITESVLTRRPDLCRRKGDLKTILEGPVYNGNPRRTKVTGRTVKQYWFNQRRVY